jgi:hypothetical protein
MGYLRRGSYVLRDVESHFIGDNNTINMPNQTIAFSNAIHDQVREIWINIGNYLRELGNIVYFLNPDPVFERILCKAGLQECIRNLKSQNNRAVPHSGNRHVINYNLEYTWREYKDIRNEFNEYMDFLAKNSIDVLTFWNDRSVGKIAAECRKTNTAFMENGYLPNTLQLDPKGVNSNSRISEFDYDELMRYKPESVDTDLDMGILQISSDYRDYFQILQSQNSARYKIWKAIDYISTQWEDRVSDSPVQTESQLPDKYIFIPFQVHDDTQILYNSQIVSTMRDVLDLTVDFIQSEYEDYEIVVKEHPVDIGRINYQSLQQEFPDVWWFTSGDINEFLQGASGVITVNSSVGFQALSHNTNVVLLGEAFYSNCPNVYSVECPNRINKSITECLTEPHNDKLSEEYLDKFSRDIFIQGGLGDIQTETIKEISGRIMRIGSS